MLFLLARAAFAVWLLGAVIFIALMVFFYNLEGGGLAIVALIVAALYGIVFFSHQLGSFLGVWLGGRLYDIYGDYTAVWWIGVAVGAFSAVVHLPIKERVLPAARAAA